MDERKVDKEELIYLERGTGDKLQKRLFWWSLFITLGTRRFNSFSKFLFRFVLLLCSLRDHIQCFIYSEKYAILKVGLGQAVHNFILPNFSLSRRVLAWN